MGGLRSCEFLNKLDLTVNFIDVDTLEESVDNMKHLTHLREIYFMGNPCQVDWPGFQRFMIASLIHLEFLDGKEITRTERILASQEYPQLLKELRILAEKKRAEKKAERLAAGLPEEEELDDDMPLIEDVDEDADAAGDDDDTTPYTIESRNEMYLELAEQKKEKEDREKERLPKERDFENEHDEAVKKARDKEDPDKPARQVNEGKLDFHFDEFEKPGFVILNVGVPKFLDLSMIDVDVNPLFVSIVCKNKVLRLNWPEEVVPDAGTAQRSKTSGMLCITVPKLDSKAAIKSIKEQKWEQERQRKKAEEEKENKEREKEGKKPKKLAEQMLLASKSVKINNIVKDSPNADKPLLTEVKQNKNLITPIAAVGKGPVVKKQAAHKLVDADDGECPPLM